ncbi:MAG: hypothetical protein E5V27_04600 [Mesorhizobium sp.]|nr:MAG: hypothetical protein E5V27_04600 [Mesorhizobium sp.]
MKYKALVGIDEAGGQHGIVWASHGEFEDMNAGKGFGYDTDRDRYFLEEPTGPELHRISEFVLKNHSTGETYSLMETVA